MKKKPLNILMICKSLPDTYPGGIQTHVWWLSEALIARGHHVTILSGQAFYKPFVREVIDGRIILRLPYPPARRLPLIGRTADQIAFNLAVNRWLRRHRHCFDLVHFQGRSGGLVSARTLRKLPGVVTYHGLYQHEQLPGFNFDDYLLVQLSHLLERNPLRRCRAKICVSHAMADMVRAAHHTKEAFHIIPNGVRELKIDFSAAAVNRKKVLMVSRLYPHKRPQTLLDAVPHLHPELQVDFIGSGPMVRQLQTRIDQEGWQHVRLLGNKPLGEVYRQMGEAMALVLPSKVETHGIVLTEANYCGRPAVCTDIPGTSEVVIHRFNGLRVPLDEPKALAAAVNRLYENPDLADELGKNGNEYVREQFSWEEIAIRTEDLYYQIIQDAA